MVSLTSFLLFAHLIGLVLGVGAATVKLVLLFRCKAHPTFVPVYISIARGITRQIVLGLIIMTLSGVGWLLLGYPFSTLLVVKLVLAGLVWVLGPIIDNVVEPGFRKLAPAAGEAVSPDFTRVENQYLAMEIAATGSFYAIIIIWVLL